MNMKFSEPSPKNYQDEVTFNQVTLLKNISPQLQKVERDLAYKAYRLSFNFGTATTTIKINIEENDTALVITNMTTLPDTEKSKGYGSQAVGTVIQWAKEQEFQKIVAAQVDNEDSERFWSNNGFKKVSNSKTGDFVYEK